MPSTGNQKSAYVRHSWRMFTQEKGWIGQLAALMLTMLVPIVGLLGVTGYSLEWARCTAWGSDAVPKRRDVDVGKCIVSGARAALISLSYSLVLWPVSHMLFILLSAVFSSNTIVQIILFVKDILVGVFVLVAALNATVYQRVSAGFDIKHVYSMISSDPKGLIGIIGVQVIFLPCVALFAVLYALQILGLMFSPLVVLILRAFGVLSLLFAGFMIFQVAFILALVGSAILSLIGTNALGLWMRQFDVASWGPPLSFADFFRNQDEFSAPSLPAEAQQPETPSASVSSSASAAASAASASPASAALPSSSASAASDPSSSADSAPSSSADSAPSSSADSAPSSSADSAPSSSADSAPSASQDNLVASGEAEQSQSGSPSTDAGSVENVQTGDIVGTTDTDTTDDEHTGQDTDENDKKMPN